MSDWGLGIGGWGKVDRMLHIFVAVIENGIDVLVGGGIRRVYPGMYFVPDGSPGRCLLRLGEATWIDVSRK